MDVQARYRRAFVFVLALPAFAASPVQGIRNFHQVNERVYRGGQPTGDGFAALSKLGVKTVIDLRETGERSEWEQGAVTAAGMKYVNVPMTGLIPPTKTEISKILELMEDESTGPVFVHCMRGADRTGAVIAAYRIDHDRWENHRALSEAKAMGMSFFQYPRKDFIRSFQARVIEVKAPAAPATAGATAQ